MLHEIRWTSKKIKKRIDLVESLVYRKKAPIPPFRYRYLTSPMDSPPVDPLVDDSSWNVIQPNDYWANPRTNFILRSIFKVPEDMIGNYPVALFLPIGVSGDFSHPEALIYIDGKPYAACDRHHQEIILPEYICDGEEHHLALHGWTGIGGSTVGDMTNKIKMKMCEVVQIHQPTRDFHAKARVAFGIAEQLNGNDPTKHNLLNSLDDAFRLLDIRDPLEDGFYKSILEDSEILERGIKKAGNPLPVNINAIE